MRVGWGKGRKRRNTVLPDVKGKTEKMLEGKIGKALEFFL
jgi:hypothetical protein